MQAGLRGDGGSDTNSAADIRTVKALLLKRRGQAAGLDEFKRLATGMTRIAC